MKKLITLALFAFMTMTAAATDYYALWKNVDDSMDRDLPRQALATLSEIMKTAEEEHEYGEFLAAQLCYGRTMGEISSDSLPPAILRLQKQLEEIEQREVKDDDAMVLAAVYNAVLAEVININSRIHLPEEGMLTPEQYYDKALRNPDILTKVKTDAYRRLVKRGSTSRVFNNDMLSLIGMAAGRYAFLKDYYRRQGNMSAACIALYYEALAINSDVDDKSLTLRREMLKKGMVEYADVPEVVMLARLYYDSMENDDDITDAARYAFLTDWLQRYSGNMYIGEMQNALQHMTLARLAVNIDKEIELSVRNLKNVKLEFLPMKADGMMKDYSVYSKEELKILQKKVSGEAKATLLRSYNGQVWEIVQDTVAIPDIPSGVYLIKATADSLTAYNVYFHSDLAVMNISLGKTQQRFAVVSAKTGKPVPGAKIYLAEENRYTRQAKNKINLDCDANGEAIWEDVNFQPSVIYVSSETDKAFRKCDFYEYFSFASSKEKRNNITIFTDRAIYRPGQTLKAGIVMHNSFSEDSVYCVSGNDVNVTITDPDNKKIFEKTVRTNEHGNAGFELTLPQTGKNGVFRIQCSSANSVSASSTVSVEEYKRPTFQIVAPGYLRDKTFHDGDSVDVVFKAETMTQLPLQNAKVVYSIHRDTYWFWRRSGGGARTIESNSIASTDDKGNVLIPLKIALPEEGAGNFTYNISVSITDEAGETHSASASVVAVRGQEPKVVENSEPYEFAVSSDRFPNDGGTIDVTIRPHKSDRKARQPLYLFCSLSAGKTVIESSSVVVTDTVYRRSFEYKKEYGEGLTVNYAWMINGNLHNYSRTLYKPRKDMRLRTTWTTFRDQTMPGSKETWTLNVKPYDESATGQGMKSVMTATIYDKSLDQLRQLSWNFSLYSGYYSFNNPWKARLTKGSDFSKSAETRYYYYDNFDFSEWDTELFPKPYYRPRYDRMLPMVEAMPMAMAEPVRKERVSAKMAGAKANSIGSLDIRANDEGSEALADLSAMVRTNLGETAFFTPSLVSDEEGNLNISFTMPETMTTWKFLGFVHDSQMRNAIVKAECVAKKDIIVKPNVPRFLREHDRGVLSANVSNTTDKAVKADVTMQFLVAGTDSVVWQKTESVTIGAEATVGVSIPAPEISSSLSPMFVDDIHCDSILVYRIVARTSDGASDGEQHILPVLPETELVTQTLAFTQHEPGTFSYDLSNILYEGSKNRKLTLKYVEHAIQMILDAVPTVVKPEHDDAMSLASAVYIMNLMNITDSANVVKRLQKLQHSDGSWSWWEGMDGSVYMTTAVAKLLARLKYHGHNTDVTDKMLSKAMPFMLKYIRKEAKELREYQKDHPKHEVRPSETACDILYITALTTLKKQNDKDVKYMIELLEKIPSEFTIYGKAHTAVLFALYNKPKKAKEFLQSLLEYTVYTDEAGRYYDSRKAYYSWRNYRIPSEVAAIEAIRLVNPDDKKTVEEMQRWLLHEKRTQAWDSSVNTVDAIYAFCLDNTELEAYEAGKADGTINVADNVKTEVVDIPADNVFRHTKTTTGTSWGGLFLEQKAPLSSIKTHGSGFTIKREILSQVANADNGTFVPTVGMKVTVRIIITADRDYDFVTVTDNRPACLEPVIQLSGYQHAGTYGTAYGSYSGYYRETRDNHTNFYFNSLAKGTHVIDTEYYIDREGVYQQGTCTVKCSYAPEFSALYNSQSSITVKK